ncbi:tryptophan-rich antigen [Plasmodium gonderi]|uniref:Tryptophan-rich antigen n=1 Tax=Plasmodium gonderi TaxID=77519 RepID=A0A1Y1JN33_PLAGO|nr:tryptophan-rich antigen [Plasmodium gonderi]GAW83889.1 tryptophan-rich antigen [Plasmodium gonderi]
MLISKYFTTCVISSVFLLRNISISPHHERTLANSEAENEYPTNLAPVNTINAYNPEWDNEWHDQLNEDWENWKLTLNEEWHNFTSFLKNDTEDLLQEKNNEWDEWIQKMQNKWSNYDQVMDKLYKSIIYLKSFSWNENDWIEWINSDWKKFMGMDWHRWINDVEYDIDTKIEDKWDQWKTEQMMLWLMTNSTFEEQYYMEKLESGNPSYSDKIQSFISLSTKISKWKTEQWENWIQDKEEYINHIKNSKWLQWKGDHYFLFNNWRNKFIKNWIKEKQWEFLIKKCRQI